MSSMEEKMRIIEEERARVRTAGRPFPDYTLMPPRKFRENHHVEMRIFRSLKRDEEALIQDGRWVDYSQAWRLVREDLAPFLESRDLEFGASYFTDDQYRLSAQMLITEGNTDTPAEFVTKLRQALERATLSGVQGTYELLWIQFGGQRFSADNMDTPGGSVSIGAPLPLIDVKEEVSRIQFMDRHEKDRTQVGLGFLRATLGQFDQESEAGKMLRYGMLLGLQAAKDSTLRRIGSVDLADLRGNLLADLGVDPEGTSISR